MTHNASHFIWYELLTTDADAAERFYGAVIGWTALRPPQGSPMDYRQLQAGDNFVGGLMALPPGADPADMPAGWLAYLSVPDVDAKIAEAVARGSRVLMPAADLPGVGRIALIKDPQGARLYVMKPEGEGVSLAFSPGLAGACGWNELQTSDAEAALKFYGDLFGFGVSHTFDMGAMGLYHIVHQGAEPVGGMMTNPAEVPHWRPYFTVPDIEAAKDRVLAQGGQVVNGPHPVPSGSTILIGRDPQGVTFALVQPAAAA